MQTIDIAIKYLAPYKAELSEVDIYSKDIAISISPLLLMIKQEFDLDINNNTSNDYYRSVCFEVALYHVLDKINSNSPTCFEVACDIIKKHKLFSKFKKKWLGTDYPEVMVLEFFTYCNELNKKPFYLLEGNEMRPDIIMSAYHYIID